MHAVHWADLHLTSMLTHNGTGPAKHLRLCVAPPDLPCERKQWYTVLNPTLIMQALLCDTCTVTVNDGPASA